MLKNKSTIIYFIIIILIVLISKNKYSRNDVIDLVAKSITPNNVYIENNIYENNSYCGFAKFYIKNNIEYIYQENNKQEKIETYINSEYNTSTFILHSEKTIIQDNYTNDDSEFLPLKNTLLEKLNNSMKYKYNYLGKEKLDETNCIKFSLISNESNDNCNYYIDENNGYIVKWENNNTQISETYKYNINTVTDEHLKMFNLDNYSDYTFTNGI
jgi:hypothetical protein